MKRYENECVDCTSVGLYCLGSSCPKRNVLHFYCDKCGCETDVLYIYDDDDFCIDCLAEELDIDVSDLYDPDLIKDFVDEYEFEILHKEDYEE